MSASDPYAWLEDVHGAKPLAWVAARNGKALGVLKADPRYRTDYESILSVLDATDRIPFGALRGPHVYNFWQDAANPKGLWRRTTIAGYQAANPEWEVLLDVDALAKAEGENWVFAGSDCAPGGARCLIRLSRGGGDAVVIREYDLKAKKLLPLGQGFSLPEAKSDAGYVHDDTGIYYADGTGPLTRSGYARQVKFWKRGDPADGHVVYDGKPDDVLVAPVIFHGGKGDDIALVVRAVSFFESEYFIFDQENGRRKLPLPLSADIKGAMGRRLIFTLRQDWTMPGGKVLPKGGLFAAPLDDGNGMDVARVQTIFAPHARQSVESVATAHGKLYAVINDNVIGAVHVFIPDGENWSGRVLPLPGKGAPGIVSTNDYGPEAMFSFENYLTPPTLYFDGGDDHPKPIKSLPARFDASGLVTEQFEAVSKDGTKIPYFVTRRKTLAAPAPTLLYGYGGFEVSLTPGYSANFGRLWLTQGGIYVVANIRGGGEFGPGWHDAALKTHRQTAFDDFAAVARDLIARKLTTPKQLGIMGGSNGGLLVATVMVQHPELLGAVVCQVPLIDMLAYTHIGAGASWIGEYGDPADPQARKAIEAYSPYQNVKKGVAMPPVLFVTATSDDRVTPVHARKMAARMEEQGHDVLFYENTDGGHAAAADHRQAAEMWALSFVYLAQRLGLTTGAR